MARAKFGDQLPTQVLVVAMGRLGGGEAGYGSDADVMFVHEPRARRRRAGGPGRRRWRWSASCAGCSGRPGPEPRSRSTPTCARRAATARWSRSLASYAEYYARWSLPWEAQALLRAAPVAGDEELGDAGSSS